LPTALVGDTSGAFVDDYEPNGGGAVGGIIFGLTGLDLFKYLGYLGYGIYNWEWSWSHVGDQAINTAGLFPLIGVIKNVDNVADVAKNTKKATQCAAELERKSNLANGIPANQLGPSGKPKIHTVDHASKKRAKDAARQDGKNLPIIHPSDVNQPPHYHATDARGNKIGRQSPHHNFPRKQR